MRATRITIGVLLVLGGALMLFMSYSFATLSAGGLENDSPEWWPTVLGAMFGAPETFLFMAGMMGGVGLCLYRPGMKMTLVGRLMVMVMAGVLAILLGSLLWAASREQLWIVGRSLNPDGTEHVVKEYRNWFGQSRTVETDEP
jgi:hypothetical protein